MMDRSSLVGLRYGRLSVIDQAAPSRHGKRRWICRCDCGALSIVVTGALRNGHSTSCGCYVADSLSARSIHGHSQGSPTYSSWMSMIDRCTNPNIPQYERYGKRGISVCDEWRSFERFLSDMGERPSLKYSLDRYPNQKGNYEPGNCRWATAKDQARNTSRSRLLTYQGRTQCMATWAEEMGFTYTAFKNRILCGWSIERALTQPARTSSKRRLEGAANG